MGEQNVLLSMVLLCNRMKRVCTRLKYSNSKMIKLEVQKYESSDQEKKSTKTIFFNKNNVIKTLMIK